MGPLFNLSGSTSWKRLKVGNKNGSYFKRVPEGATKLRRELWLRLMFSHGTLGQLCISFLFLKWRKTNGFLLFCSPVKYRIRVYKLWVFVLRLEINWKQYWVVRWLFLEEQVKTPKSFGYGRVN